MVAALERFMRETAPPAGRSRAPKRNPWQQERCTRASCASRERAASLGLSARCARAYEQSRTSYVCTY